MGNASVLQLLNDLEKQMDGYLLDFQVSEQIDEKTVLSEQTKIKKEQRLINRQETKEQEKILGDVKMRKRQEEKEKKTFNKIGKPVMLRSNKPPVKKHEVTKKDLNDEELDLRKYLEV